jgi:hypothetical protein
MLRLNTESKISLKTGVLRNNFRSPKLQKNL